MDKVTMEIKRNQELVRLRTSQMESKNNENKAYSEGCYSVPVEITEILHAEFIRNINNLYRHHGYSQSQSCLFDYTTIRFAWQQTSLPLPVHK